MKIRAVANPAALEAAGVVSGIVAIQIYDELDGPEPPHDPLAPFIVSTSVRETSIAPAIARVYGRQMRRRSIEIRQRATDRRCRRGLHLLTEHNLMDGKCRACWNAARRARRQVA